MAQYMASVETHEVIPLNEIGGQLAGYRQRVKDVVILGLVQHIHRLMSRQALVCSLELIVRQDLQFRKPRSDVVHHSVALSRLMLQRCESAQFGDILQTEKWRLQGLCSSW